MPVRPERGTLFQRGARYFEMAPAEFFWALLLCAFLFLLLLLNLFRGPIDSDEPQHLHVIWAWTRGLIQYRDVFDNHMPLFQILFAPILAVVGERATVVYWMRLALLPAYFVSGWCTYRIGSVLFSRRAGAWAVILLCLYSAYHSIAVQFRTDNLWSVFWLLCIAVLIGGRLTPQRALVSGLLLGFSFGVSMKSTLLLVSLVISGALTLALLGPKGWRDHSSRPLRCIILFMAGAVLVPGIIAIFFLIKGYWSDFRYCIFDFNLLARSLLPRRTHWLSIFSFPFILLGAGLLLRSGGDPTRNARRAFLLILCGSYLVLLESVWRSVMHQDYLPVYPLIFVLGAAYLIARCEVSFPRPGATISVLVLLAVAEIVWDFAREPIWRDQKPPPGEMLQSVLSMTRPNDYVLDAKGETIFRPRALRAVLETITQRAIARGLLPDDAPERCIATRACVVATIFEDRFSPRTQQFVERNYLPVTSTVRVAGFRLTSLPGDPTRSEFEVTIPAVYRLISPQGNLSGSLDGVPFEKARFLAAGHHVFQSAGSLNGVALIWAQAIDRGFSPFH